MWVHQFWELSKYFHNLVRTFTAGGNDHNIGLCLFRDSMLKYGFTCTERTGNKSCPPLYYRIDSVNHTYTGFKQFKRTRFFFIIRHSPFYRPLLNHIHFNVVSLFVYQNSNYVLNLIIAFRYNRFHRANTFLRERYHDLQWLEVFIHLS